MSRGRNFCAGIDLETLGGVAKLMEVEDPARGSAAFRTKILGLQVTLYQEPHTSSLHCFGIHVELETFSLCPGELQCN